MTQIKATTALTPIDPENVTDDSTMQRGEQGLPSTGLPYVIANGTIVAKNNEVRPARAGQPIRVPVETIHLDETGARVVAPDTIRRYGDGAMRRSSQRLCSSST